MRWIGVAFGCLACTSPSGTFEVYNARIDQFETVEMPTLYDARRLRGDYADGIKGGHITSRDGLAQGMPLDIRFGVRDGLTIAADQDGMYLWAAYNQVEDLIGELHDIDIDTSLLFPIQIAYGPSLPTDSSLISNAFWVCNGTGGPGTMGVIPQHDAAAPAYVTHPGVVRHEFGHNVFGTLFTDFRAGCASDAHDLWAANEGFSDVLAVLTLDDPIWNTPFLDTRDVLTDHTQQIDFLDDPNYIYEYGSVLAAFVWDLRLLSNPEELLVSAFQSVRAMGRLDPEQDYSAPEWIARDMLERFVGAYPEATEQACDHFAHRFPLATPSSRCDR